MSKKIVLELTKLEAEQLASAAGQMRDDQYDWNNSVCANLSKAAAATAAYHRAMRKLHKSIASPTTPPGDEQ